MGVSINYIYCALQFRYLAARILQPEMVFFQIRPFPGWEITLEDFGKLPQTDKDQLLAKYEALSEEDKALLELKQANRTKMEGSEFSVPGDLVRQESQVQLWDCQTIHDVVVVCVRLR